MKELKILVQICLDSIEADGLCGYEECDYDMYAFDYVRKPKISFQEIINIAIESLK